MNVDWPKHTCTNIIIVLPQDMYKLKMMRIITLILIFLMMFFDLATLLGEEAEYSNIMMIPSPDDPCNETDLCGCMYVWANQHSFILRDECGQNACTNQHSLELKYLLSQFFFVCLVST